MVTRRDFAKGTMGAGVAMAIQGTRSTHAETAPPARRRLIVDGQVHLYKAETPDSKWDPDAPKPPIPEFTVERLLPLMDEGGVDRVIIVPPGAMGDRNDYAIEVAQRYPKRFAVMGLFSVVKPNGADRLKAWKQQPGMLGVRLTFVGAHEKKLLDNGAADWFWPVAEKAGIPVMFHAPGNLQQRFASIAERHPDLTLIDDHVGMANYVPIEQSATDAIALAKYPNVSVKMKAGAQFAPEPYPYRNMSVQFRRVFDAFGPRRCHWETDLTKSFKEGGYRQRIAHFTEALDFLSEDDKDWIMGRAILERLKWA
jgi:predicted TIM-barrel fold metal-dependent hydrolase